MKIGKLNQVKCNATGNADSRYKMLLIYPSQLLKGKIHKSKKPMMYGLALPLIAALTPPEFGIKITDEIVEDINFEEKTDMVGLSVTTVNAPRAYQIADEFRSRGARVVMGGMHPSVLPEEAGQHADSVVIGEAEGVWGELIEDFKKGEMKALYRGELVRDLGTLPMPRRDLVKKDKYEVLFEPVQTTRGCPFACDFCAVSKFYGRTYRYRPIEKVVEEIKVSGSKHIFFVDDNIAADYRYSMELFEALVPLKLKWISQANITIAQKPDLCKMASKSGCIALLIGLESINSQSLASIGKTFNKVEDYRRSFRVLRKNGIIAIASMILGLDTDDVNVFDSTAKFLQETRVPLTELYFPVPYPGTELYDRLEREGRIRERDWSNYISEVVFQPKQMSMTDLDEGLWKAYEGFYSVPSIMSRLLLPPHRHILTALLANLIHRNSVKRRVQPLLG